MNRDAITNCIGVTVAESLESAVAANGGRPNEVWMLYSFFIRGLPALERRLNNILGAFSIRMTISGILCHKNPLVEFQYDRETLYDWTLQSAACLTLRRRPEIVTARCELADVTFLATYGGRLRGGGIGNALLAQTKLDSRDLGSNEPQTALYQQVRQFYYCARSHRQAHRELPPKHAPALWNWVLADGHHAHPYRGNSYFGHPQNSRENSAWRGTGWAIYQLLTGVVGEGFGLPVSGHPGWDHIMNDLIRITCRKTTRCKNVYASTLQTLMTQRGARALEAVHEVLTNHSGQVVKNSFGRIFGQWGDDELAALGKELEKPKDQFGEKELIRDFDGGGQEPPVIRDLESDNEGEGSFVIFDLEDLAPNVSDDSGSSFWEPQQSTGRPDLDII